MCVCVCVYVHGCVGSRVCVYVLGCVCMCVSACEFVDINVPGCVFAWAEARESFSVAECFRER